MKKLIKILKKDSIYIGIIAMIMLIIGVFLPGGSLAQKILFLLAAPILWFTAYLDKQKVFFALESVATLGAVIAFFPTLPNIIRYGIMILTCIVAIGWLIKINVFQKKIWAPIGALGLALLAIGFATNAVTNPMLFNGLLFGGSLLMAIYSGIEFFILKFRLAMIFLILNIVFIINPMIYILKNM